MLDRILDTLTEKGFKAIFSQGIRLRGMTVFTLFNKSLSIEIVRTGEDEREFIRTIVTNGVGAWQINVNDEKGFDDLVSWIEALEHMGKVTDNADDKR